LHNDRVTHNSFGATGASRESLRQAQRPAASASAFRCASLFVGTEDGDDEPPAEAVDEPLGLLLGLPLGLSL
jgi:hypothetical protein